MAATSDWGEGNGDSEPGYIVGIGVKQGGDAAGNMYTGERSGSIGVARGAETEAFVRPRRPLNTAIADARMERGEHGRYCGLKRSFGWSCNECE